MRKILIAALLGLCTLLPQTSVFGNGFKTVTSTIEGWVFVATSDASSGTIRKIQIVALGGTTVLLQTNCSGYSCSIDLHSLSAGQYVARVYTNSLTTYQFVKE